MVSVQPPSVLEQAVSLFLDQQWDPIGLYPDEHDEGPEPDTEYRKYAVHIVGMLRRGETAASISHYLMHQATQSMGVGPGPTRAVAEALHKWWNEDGRRLPIRH